MPHHTATQLLTPTVSERIAKLAKHLDIPLREDRDHGTINIECAPNRLFVQFSDKNVHIELHPLRHDEFTYNEPLLCTHRALPFLDKMRRFRDRWNEHGHKLDGERFRTMTVMAALFGFLLPEDT